MKQELIDQIAGLYILPGIKFVEKVEEGFLSNNFVLIQKRTKYFLKQYRKFDEDRLKEIHNVKSFFNEGGVPVILPIKNKNGRSYFNFEGAYYSMFPFIDGLHLGRKNLSKEACKNLGEMLAKIHLQGKKQHPEVMKRQSRFEKSKFFRQLEKVLPFIEKDKEKSNFGKLAHQSILLKKSIIESNKETEESVALPYDHLIHGDYHNNNVFFDKENNVTHVFDWEKTMIAPRVFELVRSMCYTFFDGEFEEDNFERALIYLSAYNYLYPISQDEIRRGIIMYFITKSQTLWIENTHYLDGSSRVDLFLENEIKTLIYLKDNFENFIGKLAIFTIT